MIHDLTTDDHFRCGRPRVDANASIDVNVSMITIVSKNAKDLKKISFVFYLRLK